MDKQTGRPQLSREPLRAAPPTHWPDWAKALWVTRPELVEGNATPSAVRGAVVHGAHASSVIAFLHDELTERTGTLQRTKEAQPNPIWPLWARDIFRQRPELLDDGTPLRKAADGGAASSDLIILLTDHTARLAAVAERATSTAEKLCAKG